MARVTVEDCLERVGNHFALVILAATRARQIERGAKPLVSSENRFAVTSLREISEGKVLFDQSVQSCLEDYLNTLRLRGAKDSLISQNEFSLEAEPHFSSELEQETEET